MSCKAFSWFSSNIIPSRCFPYSLPIYWYIRGRKDGKPSWLFLPEGKCLLDGSKGPPWRCGLFQAFPRHTFVLDTNTIKSSETSQNSLLVLLHVPFFSLKNVLIFFLAPSFNLFQFFFFWVTLLSLWYEVGIFFLVSGFTWRVLCHFYIFVNFSIFGGKEFSWACSYIISFVRRPLGFHFSASEKKQHWKTTEENECKKLFMYFSL